MESWPSMATPPGTAAGGRRISARAAAVSPSATLTVDAKAKALQAGGRARDRVRCGGAGLPHARARRGGGRRRLPRAGQPPLHAHGGAPRAARGDRRQDQARLGLRGERRPGPGDERREAGGGQRLRRPLRPRRRGAGAGPLLDHLPRVDRPGRRGAGGGARRRGQRVPGHRRAARGGGDPPHQGAALRVPLQPHRRRLPAPRDRGHRRLGRGPGHLGGHRRDLRAPRLRRRRAPLDAGARAGAGRPLPGGQRRGQDLRHDGLAGRAGSSARTTPSPPPPTSSRTRPPTWPTSPSGRRWPPSRATCRRWPSMREAFDRRRRTIHRMLNEIEGVTCLEPEGAFYAFPGGRRACWAGASAAAGRPPRPTWPSCASRRPRWPWSRARPSGRRATSACPTP